MELENTPARPGSWLHDAKHGLMRWIGRMAPVAARMFGDCAHQRFGILMYHRVCDVVPGFPAPYCNVPPQRFREQLIGLQEMGYVPRSLRDLIAEVRAGKAIAPKTFVVTFDDGYANFASQALPILRERKVPATMFLPTAYIGGREPFPFDGWPGAGHAPEESWRSLNWNECRELVSDPLIELAAHTHWHRNYSGRADEFRADIALCRETLRRELNLASDTFAFPYGAFDAALLEAALREKFDTVVTTVSRLNSMSPPTSIWHRFAVYDDDTAQTIAGRLSGWYQRLMTPLSRRQRARLGVCEEVSGQWAVASRESSDT